MILFSSFLVNKIRQPHIKYYDCILIFLFSLFFFTFALNNHEFVQFESRFAVFAQEMLRNGITFFPTVYQQPYPDYLVTQTLLIYLFSLPFHQVTAFTAILPSAIASTITLCFIYLIGNLRARLLGWYGVLFALFTFYFLLSARTISLDQFTCVVTAACFYWIYSAHVLQQKKRLWLISLCWLIGFAFRGPIGFIIPSSVSVIYYLLERNWRALTMTCCNAAGLLIICLMLLIGLAWLQGGAPFVQKVLRMQIFGRLEAQVAVPFYYYFINCFTNYALAFPVAVIIFISYFRAIWQQTTQFDFHLLRFLGVWLLIILLGMSIPSDEKMRYVLSITPAISLSAAYILYWEHTQRFLIYLKNFLHHGCLLLPFLSLIALIITLINSKQINLIVDINYYQITIILTALCLIAIFYQLKFAKLNLYQPSVYFIGLLTFILLYSLVVQPINVQFNRSKPFVDKVTALQQPQQALVFYKIGPDGEDIKYLVAANKPLQPIFLAKLDELMRFKQSAVFIAKNSDFVQLDNTVKNKLRVLMTGRLGHEDCVVFTKLP